MSTGTRSEVARRDYALTGINFAVLSGMLGMLCLMLGHERTALCLGYLTAHNFATATWNCRRIGNILGFAFVLGVIPIGALWIAIRL